MVLTKADMAESGRSKLVNFVKILGMFRNVRFSPKRTFKCPEIHKIEGPLSATSGRSRDNLLGKPHPAVHFYEREEGRLFRSPGFIRSRSHKRAQCQPMTRSRQSAWFPSSPPLDKVQQA